MATWFLSMFEHLADHNPDKGALRLTARGTLKFGSLATAGIEMDFVDVHCPIVIGIVGGLLGSFFINVNTTMMKYRKKYVTTTTRKLIETGMFAVATMSVSIIFISLG